MHYYIYEIYIIINSFDFCKETSFISNQLQYTCPNGDVPKGKGVCTDVIIRAYRKIGIDLQKEVHEDMKAYFYLYPKIWNLKKPDRNIDHRRVPNLMVYMTRKGKDLPLSNYMPGDIICWNLNGSVTHIGIVSNVKNSDGEHYNIIHNIGQGQVLEDCLFSYPIIGHYKYLKTLP